MSEHAEIPPPWWLRILIGRRPKRTFIRLIFLVAACLVLFKLVIVPIRVTGVSMLPTYADGRRAFVNRLAYVWGKPQRGDVVAVRMGRDAPTRSLGPPKVMLLKRVIGLPQERFAIRNGMVEIDDVALVEPYVKLENVRRPWRIPERVLGADEYYLIGDNRGMDQDQHEFGRAKLSQLVGKVMF